MGLFGFLKKNDGPSPDDRAKVMDLITQLDNDDPKIRLAACNGLRDLAALGEPAAPKLLDMIDDKDGDVCLAASEALTEIQRETGC